MLNLVQLMLGAASALAAPVVGDLPDVVRLESPVIAAHGESAALLLLARDPVRGYRSSVVWAERDRSSEGSTTFRRASVLRLPGAPSVGSAVSAVHTGPLAQSGDGKLLAFRGSVRDANTGDKSTGLVVAQIVDKPGEPGSFAHRALCIDTAVLGETTGECTRLTFAPERPRLFVLGEEHVLAVDIVVDAASGELVVGHVETVDRANDGTPADRGPECGCCQGPVQTDAVGRFVVYTSWASNLDPDQRTRGVATYVTDLDPQGTGKLEPANRRTLLVSLDRHGAFLDGTKYAPQISADGRWIVVGTLSAVTEDRVAGGRTAPSSSKSVELLLYDLDPDRDGVIGNTELRPRPWNSLIARGRQLTCTRATSRGWLVTRFAGGRRASLEVLELGTDTEGERWELGSADGTQPLEGGYSASFDGHWLVGCRELDGESPDHLGEYLFLRRIP